MSSEKLNKIPILIIAGEHSGDLLGGSLMKELKHNESNIQFHGIGGPSMLGEGLDSLADIEDLSVIGFNGILLKYNFLKQLANKLVDYSVENNIRYAILIDYPGFNLRLAQMLKSLDIQVIFYVSPQLWAWRFNRIYTIQKVIDLMLVLFPFEKKIYDEYNIPCVYTGHPVGDNIKSKIHTEKTVTVNENHTVITLMPGSRKGEIRKLLDIILQSAEELHKIYLETNRHIHFLLPNINQKCEKYILDRIQKIKKRNPEMILDYCFDNSLKCIEKSEMVIVASGTATLEVAYFEKPMIIVYKISMFTYFLGTILVKSPFIGIVNLLGGKEICRELLQAECKPYYIVEEALNILEHPKYKEKMINDIANVKNSLIQLQSSKVAAKSILELIRNSPSIAPEQA